MGGHANKIDLSQRILEVGGDYASIGGGDGPEDLTLRSCMLIALCMKPADPRAPESPGDGFRKGELIHRIRVLDGDILEISKSDRDIAKKACQTFLKNNYWSYQCSMMLDCEWGEDEKGPTEDSKK